MAVFITYPNIPKQLGLSQREYQIAVCNIGFRYFASEFKNAPSFLKEDNYQGLAYYGALHDLMMGAKTPFYLFVNDPNGQELDLLDNESILIDGYNSEEIKLAATQHLFRGNGTSTIRKFGKDAEFVILY